MYARELGCWLRVVGDGSSARLRVATEPRGDALVPTPEEAATAAMQKAAEAAQREAEAHAEIVRLRALLGERGEVYVVAHEGAGLGRAVKVIRAEANGVRSMHGERMRALLADDLDDDGYDDLVVAHPTARCLYLPVERYCSALGWLAVYRGGAGGLDAHLPWVYAPEHNRRGSWLGYSAARVGPTAPGPARLWVGPNLSSLTLAVDLSWTPTELIDVPFAVDRHFAMPTASDPGATLVHGDGWYLRTGEGSAAQMRALAPLPSEWRESHAELTDANGDGEADLVRHADSRRRAGVFVSVGDGTGRFTARGE